VVFLIKITLLSVCGLYGHVLAFHFTDGLENKTNVNITSFLKRIVVLNTSPAETKSDYSLPPV
jgi:hypothetical protein